MRRAAGRPGLRRLRAGAGHRGRPQAALAQIPEASCDLFVCTYVFELLPTPEHGHRVLRIARRLLRPGGAAFLQFRYETGSWRTRSRRWGYGRHLADHASYRVEDFWQATSDAGIEPLVVSLVPEDPLGLGDRYADLFATRRDET